MKYRAAVRTNSKYSEAIRVWTQDRSGDVYFGIRATAQSFKVSFHASGECHEGIHGKAFERMEEAGLSEATKKKGRIWHKWNRPIDYEGIYAGFCIILPSQGYRQNFVDESIPHFDIGDAPAAIFTLYFARVKRDGVLEVNLDEQVLCVKHRMPNLEWVIVTLSAIDLPALDSLNTTTHMHDFSRLHSIENAIDTGDSLRAMAFVTIKKNEFEIPCLLETSIRVARTKANHKQSDS